MPLPVIPWRSLLHGRFGGAWLALGIVLLANLCSRAALLLKSSAELSWGPSLLAVFPWGFVYDLGSGLLLLLPWILLLAVLPARWLSHPLAKRLLPLAFLVLMFGLAFGAVAEWLFWDEFGVRANFIAVDYLVYTTEVTGNIRESFSVPLIMMVVSSLSLIAWAGLMSSGWLARWLEASASPAAERWRSAGMWILAATAGGLFLDQHQLPDFENNYNRELAKSGLWSFGAAFRANQLDYDHFYPTLSDDEAFTRLRAEILRHDGAAHIGRDSRDLLRQVQAQGPGPELRLNVIQITVESLSAEFLARYGNTQSLTPNIDALIPRSLVFDRCYATGNRTDRGMEALTLSVPPTPGRSLVKRPGNEGLFTLGSVFRSKGYTTSFIYGGYGYFDNMNHFFGGNGYRVVDRNAVASSDVSFANVWGACDEDLLRWTLREADADHASGRPFFHFVMTTSNHRPFTYPEGRIDLPPKDSGRSGGVKYTDHALGEFLREAERHPWYRNTVFVIVADHCASSAGRTGLPVQNYHIPLILFAPGGQIAPGVVQTLMSQVDYAPTLLGLLNWSYPSRFFGWDVMRLPPGEPGRALIGNYQQLGLLRDNRLAMLQPLRRQLEFDYDPASHALRETSADPALIQDTIATYQAASCVFRNGHQRQLAP